MGNPLDSISDKVQDWMRCWGAVILTPRTFFSARRRPNAISTFHFFIGNQLLAYLLLFCGSILFFFLYYRDRLLRHAGTTGLAKDLAFVTAFFAAFVLLSFVLVFLSSLITVLVARVFGSRAPFTKHVNSFLHLSAIEPLAMLGFAVFLLASDPNNIHPIPFFVEWTGLGLWALSRLWSFVAGFFAVSYVHPLSLRRRILLYSFGFVPGYAVFQVCHALYLYLLIVLVYIPIGD